MLECFVVNNITCTHSRACMPHLVACNTVVHSRIKHERTVVPNAVKFEVVHEAANGSQKEVTVLGFFTKDEIVVWFRDFQAIVARNHKRAAHEMKGKEKILQIKDKEEEPDGVGRCVLLLVTLSRLRARAGISPSALRARVCMHILMRQCIRTGRQQD